MLTKKEGVENMKRKSVISIAVLLALGALLYAQTPNPTSDFSFDLNKDFDAITITRYNGRTTRVVVPAEIEGVPVRVIGNEAFYGNRTITEVVIPNTVTTIANGTGRVYYMDEGRGAFMGCSNLVSITLPNSLTHIGSRAFAGCAKITSITIPDSVITIGSGAFFRSGLTSIKIPDSVVEIGEYTFSICNSLVSVILPNGITKIARNLFSSCNNLASVTIPDTVTTIDGGAFEECISLVSITFPASVKEIWGSAFKNCTNLSSVVLAEDAKNIFQRWDQFLGCSKMSVQSRIALNRAGYTGSF